MVTAIVLITAQADRVPELAKALVEVKGVSEVFSVAGRWDLVAIVRVGSNEDLATVVSDRIRKLPGIVASETLIAFRAYSQRELEAAFALGLES
ncbi:MAG: Lrp/AsnC ligand binding domain-containing protein [Gammaproteobacteria bacterium]|nr:Lrp/AsnC ligand binding domain-containing protein [Gammaproteobacteria bacterium]